MSLYSPPKDPFRKYIFWLTKAEESGLRKALAARGIELRRARGTVCGPLGGGEQVWSVGPEVWSQTCARQGSWYRASGKNGLFLVISPCPLEGYEDKMAATITESSFVPPRRAGTQEKMEMVGDPALAGRVPAQWLKAKEKEKAIFLRWAQKLGSEAEDFEDILLSHTANHANFLNPRFFVREQGTIIPYSIDRTANLCSCCLELFLVIGSGFEKRLVAPCPGATLFARLRPDRYLLVEKTDHEPPPPTPSTHPGDGQERS